MKCGQILVEQFPLRLQNAALFIDSYSLSKHDVHSASGWFHHVKLVIWFIHLHQGADVFTCWSVCLEIKKKQSHDFQ